MVVRIGQKSGTPRKTYFKEWRQFRGLTQQRLADRLGTGKSAVSKMERGASKYNQSSLEAWAVALDCDPADLISRHPEWPDLRALLERASPEDRARAIAVVETLLKSVG